MISYNFICIIIYREAKEGIFCWCRFHQVILELRFPSKVLLNVKKPAMYVTCADSGVIDQSSAVDSAPINANSPVTDRLLHVKAAIIGTYIQQLPAASMAFGTTC